MNIVLPAATLLALLAVACVGERSSPPSVAGANCTETDLAPAATAEQRQRASLLFREGMADVAACHYGDGIAKLNAARALVPARNVIFDIARAYQESGDRPSAIRTYREYLDTGPCDGALVAPVLAQLEQAEAARRSSSPPKLDLRACAHRLFGEAMIEIQAKRYEAGIVKLKQANDAVPAPNVLFNIGRAYRDAGELEKSVEYLRKYVATNPTDREDVEKAIARTEEELRAKGGTKP